MRSADASNARIHQSAGDHVERVIAHRFNCDETSRRRLSVQICSANSAPFNIQTVQS